MKTTLPLISVVLNVYNEQEIIAECLSRIREQNYPQKNIEIIIVDDDSTDDTIKIAKQFRVKVVRSGHRNRERAKSIGLEQVNGEILLLMDADVFLMPKNYIRRTVELLMEHPTAVAAQSIRWEYKKNDHMINRYCNLFGIADPMALFLGKRGALMETETVWPYKDTIVEQGKDYFLAKFTPQNLPTIGAIGYMVRKKDIYKTSWKPYFFHLDTAYELVAMGKNEFLLTKLAVEHRFVYSFSEYFGKLMRNMQLFLELQRHRKYNYDATFLRVFFAVLLMVTILYPFSQSIRGYSKRSDLAWFLHPLFCFFVPILYSYIVLKWRITNRLKTR